jgi:hypothetical protein
MSMKVHDEMLKFPVGYELVEANDDHWAIQLTEGKYAGVVYRYGTVKFMGEDEEGNGRVTFEYDILDPRDFQREALVGPEIDEIFGRILHDIIVESLEKEELNGKQEKHI